MKQRPSPEPEGPLATEPAISKGDVCPSIGRSSIQFAAVTGPGPPLEGQVVNPTVSKLERASGKHFHQPFRLTASETKPRRAGLPEVNEGVGGRAGNRVQAS